MNAPANHDAFAEALRDEFDLLCLPAPSPARIAAEWNAVAGGGGVSERGAASTCPSCAAMRRMVARMVAAGIDWLDDGEAGSSDLEDDEREIVSEDDGVVDAITLGRMMR